MERTVESSVLCIVYCALYVVDILPRRSIYVVLTGVIE